MMASYIAVVVCVSPSVSIIDVVAASAIVMFAAAFPLSIAGWGPRELAAISAFGLVGIEREAAVVTAVLVGVASFVVGLGQAVAIAFIQPDVRQTSMVRADHRSDPRVMLAWSVPALIAMAVFFQIHVPLSGSQLNLNIADPLAFVGAAALIIDGVTSRTWPRWRLPHFNVHLALMTLAILGAFIHGLILFGVTPWALTNRLSGWFVLLAYLASGTLIVTRGGEDGFRLLLKTFCAAAVGIILVDLVIFSVVRIGITVPIEIISYRMEGFSQNANAFALQLLLATAGVIAVTRPAPSLTLWLGTLCIGLWFTGSRSGLVATTVPVLSALALRAVRPTAIAIAIVATAATIGLIGWLPELIEIIGQTGQWAATGAYWVATNACNLVADCGARPELRGGAAVTVVAPEYSPVQIIASGYALSYSERIASLRGGLAMFHEHPILGAGLGAFMHSHL